MSVRLTVTRDGEEVEVERTTAVRLGDEVLSEDWSWTDLSYSEAESMEATYGGTLLQLQKDVGRGSKTAERILLWTLLRRKNPKLKLTEVNPKIGEFEVDITDVDVDAGAPDPTPGAPDANEPTPTDA